MKKQKSPHPFGTRACAHAVPPNFPCMEAHFGKMCAGLSGRLSPAVR
ncbi:hypothetical protein KNP414_02630 [Paenibacillus mucilaginosus KNP414]|uniref:Uncharacterized protein n=1 Tax=Paenibacillus mucilaginosus (strain KNP414) TaxID=1036673 RepID=F8F5L8_PAEMK|nr:hypothetical protein KNP414_02630 [Paenibacillus mucilaginosus KNP414]